MNKYNMLIKELLTEFTNRKIGKVIGGQIYVHKDYVDSPLLKREIPLSWYKLAVSKLPPDFDYTVVRYDLKDGSIAFISSPDFDTADEPTVGTSIKVTRDGNVKVTKPLADPWIWHHKWEWVGDDYSGFDVEQSKARSEKWKSIVGVDKAVSSRIGKKSYWDREIVPKIK